jgi:polyhydroxyalkanoate synthase
MSMELSPKAFGGPGQRVVDVKLDESTAAAAKPAPARVDGDNFDRSLRALLAPATGGLSPAALVLAFSDWALHLAVSPGRRAQLAEDACRDALQFADYAAHCLTTAKAPWSLITPQPQDRRFSHPGWTAPPFNVAAQGFLLMERWWHSATAGVRGVARQNEAIVEFTLRQLLDTLSPANFALSNPAVIEQTLQSGGENLVYGLQNWLGDFMRLSVGRGIDDAENFVVGKQVAISPGKIVFRNDLIELIQYTPTTAQVRPEPILIVPAWIMKYYILDLTPRDSLVKFLTDEGFTVFMISWRNPTSKDRNRSLEDYRTLGVHAALDTINAIMPDRKVHATGYCLGGTLLAIEAAALSRDGDDRMKSVTLLAAQTDFTEAGELSLFINESQVAFLEDMMWERGVLETSQMAGAFQILRSNDLVWSRIVRDYLMGGREPLSDLMAWNADATRMPYRMHSEYLRHLFLDNDLAEGHYFVGGKPIALSDIRTPIFAVGTEWDHVAPWKSTHKIHFQSDAEVTYVLTTGGHNAGIVSPLSEDGRHYHVQSKPADTAYIGPDEWRKTARRVDGSWWPEWSKWLEERSGAPCPPPKMGLPADDPARLDDAPGSYVLQR